MTNKLIGQKFERLLVISAAGKNKHRQSLWLCRCDCGVEKTVAGGKLRNGNTKSCGCLRRQSFVERNTTHGLSKTPEYHAWFAARFRCTNPNYEKFHNYGGRGIKFLLPDFAEFLAHIGPRPGKEYSLDRINNKTGHYEIGNIRWATDPIQRGNKRNNVNLAYQGKIQHAKAWSRELGIHKNTIHSRIKRGWSVEKTLSTPVKGSF